MRSRRRHAACLGDAATGGPELVRRVDQRAFHRPAGMRSPVLDRVLRPLSRAADQSVPWTSAAALLATPGGRRGRRAALRGLLPLGAIRDRVHHPSDLLAGVGLGIAVGLATGPVLALWRGLGRRS